MVSYEEKRTCPAFVNELLEHSARAQGALDGGELSGFPKIQLTDSIPRLQPMLYDAKKHF